MKALTISLLTMLSLATVAAPTQKTVTGEKAQDLFQALYKSGVEMVELEDGFATLNEENIYCRVTREHAVSGGIFQTSPECYAKAQSDTGFQFDKKLEDTTQLMEAMNEAGADGDGAMGSFYISAEKIYCKYVEAQRSTTCTMETYQ